MYSIISYIIKILLIITFIIGLFNYKHYKDTPLKYFIYFLAYGIATEIFGRFFFYKFFKFANYIVYNVYALVQFIFFLWLFYKYFKTKKYKNLTVFFLITILLFFALNTIFFQNIFETLQSYFYLLGGIFLIISTILFFIELLNSDAILNIKHLLIFWVGVGIFLFQLGFIPVFITKSIINISHGLTYSYILLILNIISCTCYSLGFLWSKKGIDY